MINLSVRPQGLHPNPLTAAKTAKALPVSSQSFARELSTVAKRTVNLAVEQKASQTNVSRQTSATSANLAAETAPYNGLPAVIYASVSTAPIASAAKDMAATVPVPANVPAPSTSSYVSSPADDAYWAKQPAAVQQLRNVDDPTARSNMAAQLASEGYSVDVPVMVWGWDPAKATQLRQDFGYTWVPSAFQQPVESAPGISTPGIQPYDPAHPPVGSIVV